MNPLEQHIARSLEDQQARNLRRNAPLITFREGLHYQVKGQPVLSFCSNDFLGFGSDDLNSTRCRGGSGASRLIHGNHEQIRELEHEFAAHLGFEAAILLPSGYQANHAGLAQLPLPPQSKIFSDAYNHASIIDALRLRAEPKNILPHLQAPPSSNNWWVVESRFSMDGDAPSKEALDAHLKQGGYLYLDEAHRFGLEGGGQGLAHSLRAKPQLANFPLGKAFGLQGAILAGDTANIEWVKQFSRAYTYTTAPGPAQCQIIQHRLQELAGETGEERRTRLNQNIKLAGELFDTDLQGPILSMNLRENQVALKASHALLSQGFHVQAIRPPTVPEGSARLRITLSALHEPEELRDLHQALTQTLRDIQR